MDKTGINLTVEDGQHATAGELFEMVMDEMKFPHEAREAFSLWLVSDLLGAWQFLIFRLKLLNIFEHKHETQRNTSELTSYTFG